MTDFAQIRKQVFKREKGFCEGCGKYQPIEIGEAHHTFGKKYLIFSWLCNICHRGYYGVHGINKQLREKLKQKAIKRLGDIEDYLDPDYGERKKLNKELRKTKRENQLERYKKNNNGMTPRKTQYLYFKNKKCLE